MNSFLYGLMSSFIILSVSGFAQTFSTNFDGTENPLSENGIWSHNGLDWKKVQKVNGIAYGTQTGSGGYDDSYAYLSGFPANQSASGVIQRTSGSSGIHEVEIHLRWSDAAHSAKGYECLLSYDASYAQIVRWNGPLGDFTYIGWAAKPPMPKTGDTFSGSITGNLIIAYYNGVEIMRATDTNYHTGNPGMGFYRESAEAASDMAFTSYTATGLGTDNKALWPAATASPQRPLLSWNQANGFKQGVTLLYKVPVPSYVTLKICDMFGRKAATLVSEFKPVGGYSFWFDGSALASRVWAARLTAGGEGETRKILLLK
jgi:hypothetical protein